MHYMHPFVLKIKDMGWVAITHEDRPYPSGDFDEEVFIKTYIKLHHSFIVSLLAMLAHVLEYTEQQAF
ncbi:hypothetical protein [Neobacillus mesonae]|uniref:hypothetical protein n=1 Tax=Neobacillus mesonae TaxID=1193713 RepID=UPI00203DEEB9|nr:hypothetical protein [Neobacillus mesonae]MCM3571275.1 hypothetical protein [Neobacillus mesonae]